MDATLPEVSTPEKSNPAPAGRRWPFVLVALALVAGAAVFFVKRSPGGGSLVVAPKKASMVVESSRVVLAPDAPQWQFVKLGEASSLPALQPLPVPARVAIDEQRSSAVGAPLAGRVESVLVRLGDRVHAGQKLFLVRSGNLADLERDVAQAQVGVSSHRRIAERTKELVKIAAAPEKDAIAAEAELEEAEAALDAARARMSSLRVTTAGPGRFWVSAPRDGTVVELDVSSDQEVSPDRDHPLMRIAELSEVIIVADLQPGDVRDVHPGTQAAVRVQGDENLRSATVDRVSELLDPVRRTVEVRLRAPNRDRVLRPNAFAEVQLARPAGSRIIVPSSAIVTDADRSFVFVSQPGGSLARTSVAPGRSRDGMTEVVTGLAAGERIVTGGAILLLNAIDLTEAG